MEPRVDVEERNRMVAEAAYFRAERRGFAGGDPVADWVEAEAEVEASLQEQRHGARRQTEQPLGAEHHAEQPLGAERHAEQSQGAQRHAKQRHAEQRPAEQRQGDVPGQVPGQPGPQHDELLARIEDGVTAAGIKVEALRKKAGDVETSARAEVQQQLDRIAELRDALEARRNQIREQGSMASRSLLEQAESLWNELTAFLSRKAPAPGRRSSRRK